MLRATQPTRSAIVLYLENKNTMKKRDRVYTQNINIYVLELENGCYYVGQSINVERRLEEHRIGKGASFTKLNPVLSLVEIFVTKTKKLIEGELYEDFFVMKYIDKYGADKVKGGTFLGSSRKRANKFQSYKYLFFEAQKEANPPQAFFNKLSSLKKFNSVSH